MTRRPSRISGKYMSISMSGTASNVVTCCTRRHNDKLSLRAKCTKSTAVHFQSASSNSHLTVKYGNYHKTQNVNKTIPTKYHSLLKIEKCDLSHVDTNPRNNELASKWIPGKNSFLQQWHECYQVETGALCYNVLQIVVKDTDTHTHHHFATWVRSNQALSMSMSIYIAHYRSASNVPNVPNTAETSVSSIGDQSWQCWVHPIFDARR